MAITVNLTLNVPSAQEVDDFVYYHGYTDKITNEVGEEVDNPETKGEFAKKKVISFVRESIKAKRANDAADAARSVKIAEVDGLTIS